jgi:hypothetical protein
MKTFASILMIALLAACSGGAQSTIPAANSTQSKSKAVPASILIKIPPASASSSTKRPAYISASTQSISGTISPASGCSGCSAAIAVATNLTPSSSGCSPSGGTTTCTITFSLNPGNYVATLTTYSGTLSSGAPTGYALSTDQAVGFTITAGKANTISMIMGGVPSGVDVTGSNGTNNSYVPAGGTAYFDGVSSSLTLAISATDAEGNAIIGPGAPTMTFTVTGGNGWTISSSTATTATVTAPANGTVNSDYLNVAFNGVAGACSVPHAGCTQLVELTFMPHLVVPANVNSGSGAYLFESPLSDVYIALNGMTVTSGLAQPDLLAFDSKGDVFVTDEVNNAVYEYPYPITSNTPLKTISLSYNPTAIAVDANNNLIVATTSTLQEYTASSNYATANSIGSGTDDGPSGLEGVTALVASPSGTLYAIIGGAAGAANAMTFSGTNYATTGPITFSSGLNNPIAAEMDKNGNIWVANNGTGTNGTVTEYTSGGSAVPSHTLPTGGAPDSLSIDSAGDVAVDTGTGGTGVLVYTAASSYGTPDTLTGVQSPLWMPDGQLAVLDNTGSGVILCTSYASDICSFTIVGPTGTTVMKYPPALWP